MNLAIFPLPRQCMIGTGIVDLGAAEWIVLPEACSRRLRERIEATAELISRHLNRPVRVAAAVPQAGVVLLAMRTGVKRLAPQGFVLEVGGDTRLLTAGGEAGAYYGLLAFAQLTAQFGGALPPLVIKDEPDFAVRGVMLDVSRCKVPTMETCKLLIDRLAGMRINQLQLYIEHTFAFSAHSPVWSDASPFTHEEILALDQYCTDRFIELVPNLNSFGHFERWLRHPEYRHMAECPDGYEHPWGGRSPWGSTLAPTNTSLRFLEALYDEFLPNFSSRTFNVGCDETWELGKGRTKARAEKTSVTAVYFDFINQIHKLCVKKGRRMQFWGDIILHQPELIKTLPPDILALCWGYEENHPFEMQCKAFASAGIEYHVCPGTSAWNSITGRTDNCLANLANAAENGLRHGATGYLNTDWGDGGHHQVLPVSYVGFAAGAAYSWHLKTNRDADLAGAISRHLLADPSGKLGSLCLDLGRTLNRLPGLKRGNCSAINQLLFWNLSPATLDLAKVTRAQYGKAESWLDKLAADLASARPCGEDASLVMREFAHTIDMSRHAIHRGRFGQFGEGDAGDLRRERLGLVMSHEEQWLARNRRGGLYESSTRLRNTGE